METIGRILENGEVEKGGTIQGFVYKNFDNFYARQGICYISEYGCENVLTCDEEGYDTYESMLKETKRIYEREHVDPKQYPIELMIETVFDMVDWQGFETLLIEIVDSLDDDCFLEIEEENENE